MAETPDWHHRLSLGLRPSQSRHPLRTYWAEAGNQAQAQAHREWLAITQLEQEHLASIAEGADAVRQKYAAAMREELAPLLDELEGVQLQLQQAASTFALKESGVIFPHVFFRLVSKGRKGKQEPRVITSFIKAWRKPRLPLAYLASCRMTFDGRQYARSSGQAFPNGWRWT